MPLPDGVRPVAINGISNRPEIFGSVVGIAVSIAPTAALHPSNATAAWGELRPSPDKGACGADDGAEQPTSKSQPRPDSSLFLLQKSPHTPSSSGLTWLDPRIHAAPTSGAMDPRLKCKARTECQACLRTSVRYVSGLYIKPWDDGDWGLFCQTRPADETSHFMVQRGAVRPRRFAWVEPPVSTPSHRPQAAFVTASIGCCERKPTASRFQMLMAPIATVIFVISSSEKCAFNVS